MSNPVKMKLSTNTKERKQTPITTGVLDYFPLAMAEVAKCSFQGNEQHNKGEPLHWDKTKSTDHADCIARHLIDRYSVDTDGVLHAAKLAWRALAFLETLLEGQQNVAVVKPEEPLTVKTVDDGWIIWTGGKCPIAGETEVDVKLRECGEHTLNGYAENFRWKHEQIGSDITAYKIKENK
jgi:hypothetical protein